MKKTMKNLAISIDIGASRIRIALITKTGMIIKKLESPMPQKAKRGKEVTEKIIVLIKELSNNFKSDSFLGIGIGSAGPISLKQGKLINPTNIPFREISLVKPIEKKFNLPVSLLNDCTCAAWGEKVFGKGKKYKNLVYISISSGIGGGAIVDNHLLIGKDGNAAEIGHFALETKYNLPCNCKKGMGHWESYSSAKNLLRFFKQWTSSNNISNKYNFKKAEEIFQLAKEKTISDFLKEVGDINVKGISNVIVAYDPEIIMLGGTVFLKNKNIILPYLKQRIKKPPIVTASLKENAPLLGAAALVFYPPTR